MEPDFHDVYLLISAEADVVVAELRVASPEVRERINRRHLEARRGREVTAAAARQIVRPRPGTTQGGAEAAVRGAAISIQQRLGRAD